MPTGGPTQERNVGSGIQESEKSNHRCTRMDTHGHRARWQPRLFYSQPAPGRHHRREGRPTEPRHGWYGRSRRLIRRASV